MRALRGLFPVLGIGLLLAGCGASGNPAAVKHEARQSSTTAPPRSATVFTVGEGDFLTVGGKLAYTVKLDAVVVPATPSSTLVTPTPPGDIFVAAEFTFQSLGQPITEDIYNDVKLYTAAGQGFTSDFEAPSNGPAFPSGMVTVSPDGVATGWVMFDVPPGRLGTLTYVPGSGFDTAGKVRWTLAKYGG